MAKSSKKKAPSGTDNKDRPNGKAWKKPRQVPLKKTNPSLERQMAKYRVITARQARKLANIARREAEAAAREADLAEEELIREAEERNEKRRKGKLMYETLGVKSVQNVA